MNHESPVLTANVALVATALITFWSLSYTEASVGLYCLIIAAQTILIWSLVWASTTLHELNRRAGHPVTDPLPWMMGSGLAMAIAVIAIGMTIGIESGLLGVASISAFLVSLAVSSLLLEVRSLWRAQLTVVPVSQTAP